MKDDEELFWLVVLVWGLVMLIAIGLVAALIWFIITSAVAYIQYRQYLKEAENTFDELANELGVNLPVDDILRASWAMGIQLPEDGFHSVADWMSGTPLGVTA
jgi:hypothetical protein